MRNQAHSLTEHQVVGPNTTIARAYLTMTKLGLEHMPVVHGGKVVGLLNLSELQKLVDHLAYRKKGRAQTVGGLMNTRFSYYDGKTNLGSAISDMLSSSHHAIIVTENGEFKGILYPKDLLNFLIFVLSDTNFVLLDILRSRQLRRPAKSS